MMFLAALVAGLMFGAGLLLSGMADPQRVLGFLDVAGNWDPSLALTMAGAIAAAVPAFWWVRRHRRDLRGDPVQLPNRRLIDPALLGGAALFGVGWGLSGICPGPGLLLLTGRRVEAVVFFAAVIAGMVLLHGLQRWQAGAAARGVV